mmetsp:Transcript_20915/g.52622  ORF Transcript_20915/g.52622 Transcript_20915/m.52622 type:complete len:241 (+) Transcript_20915:139-861(+)
MMRAPALNNALVEYRHHRGNSLEPNLWAASRLEGTPLDPSAAEGPVLLSVLLHHVIVVLVVNLAGVKGKLLRVVDQHRFVLEGVALVALGSNQLHPPDVPCGLEGLEKRARHTTRKPKSAAVLATTVLGIGPDALDIQAGNQEVCKRRHLALRDLDDHHLSVPHASVVRVHQEVVVAHLAILSCFGASRVAHDGGVLAGLAAEDLALSLNHLMLHMPKAARTHVQLDHFLASGLNRARLP